ncbi:MAG: hypothetical protein GF355_00405, partial [Candidatus Eisenbacteria bacterium]|nr:hypothetical protein [Candidatus Eisenbacteria bacterium]
AMVRRSSGGAIALFAASSVASSSANAILNRRFLTQMFPGLRPAAVRPLGAAALAAKSSQSEVSNARRYATLGDPLVSMAVPRHEISLEMLDANGGTPADSLVRGRKVRIEGSVRDTAGVTLSDFDGRLHLHIYDSEIQRRPTFLDRDDYNLLGAPIYRGFVEVVAGEFRLELVVPRSLRLGDRGLAKVFAYAEDGVRDAMGCLPRLIISETEDGVDDVQGPSIELELADGDTVAVPGDELRIALEDSSGINITELVGSRSVSLRYNDTAGRPVLVEDLAARVEFTSGAARAELTVRIPDALSPGRSYEAVLRASDNLNNRAEASLRFRLQAAGDEAFRLGRVFNMPNPTDGETWFFLEAPGDLDVEISIYTSGGRRIQKLEWWSVRGEDVGPAAGRGLHWDGRDADGDRLGNGVYFYRVKVRERATGETATRIERLAVLQ